IPPSNTSGGRWMALLERRRSKRTRPSADGPATGSGMVTKPVMRRRLTHRHERDAIGRAPDDFRGVQVLLRSRCRRRGDAYPHCAVIHDEVDTLLTTHGQETAWSR